MERLESTRWGWMFWAIRTTGLYVSMKLYIYIYYYIYIYTHTVTYISHTKRSQKSQIIHISRLQIPSLHISHLITETRFRWMGKKIQWLGSTNQISQGRKHRFTKMGRNLLCMDITMRIYLHNWDITPMVKHLFFFSSMFLIPTVWRHTQVKKTGCWWIYSLLVKYPKYFLSNFQRISSLVSFIRNNLGMIGKSQDVCLEVT